MSTDIPKPSGRPILVAHLLKEFNESVKKQSKTYVTFRDVLDFRNLDSQSLDFSHIGTIYLLFSGVEDGCLSQHEIVRFGNLCQQLQSDFKGWELSKCVCLVGMMALRKKIITDVGLREVGDWLCDVFNGDAAISEFESFPSVEFYSRDSVQLLYRVIRAGDTYGIDFQAFFDLLQRCGEEQSLLTLEDDTLDEVVPKIVFRQLVLHFLEGLRTSLGRVCNP